MRQYLLIAVAVIVVAALVYFASLQKPVTEKPEIGVGEEEINALGEYTPIDMNAEIGTDVLPSDEELNTVEVNEQELSIDLPEEI